MTTEPRPFVYIGVPSKYTVEAPHMLSVLELMSGLAKRGIGSVYRHEDMGGITIARSMLAGTFREHPRATHLLMIDDDVADFSADDVARMLHSGKDLIGGPVPGRCLDPSTLYSAVAEGVPPEQIHRYLSPVLMKRLPGGQLHVNGHALEVEAIGTGFLLMSRGCIERMIAELPGETSVARIEGRKDVVMVFDFGVDETGGLVGEDYGFCFRWRAIGGTVWADTMTRLSHIGRQTFQAAALDDSMGIAAERVRRTVQLPENLPEKDVQQGVVVGGVEP